MNPLRKIPRTLLAALREIFDEAAYQRFLERAGLASSPQAYAEFLREQERNSSPRPRCC
jgi:hypothetical protein